jgi:hypothetical protein
LQSLRSQASGFGWIDACGADGRGNSWLLLSKRCKSGLARLGGARLRQLLEERVNGFAERAGEQASFVALVEAAGADKRFIGCWSGRSW